MMNNYITVDKRITDIEYEYYQKKDTLYCDNIMSFDIEVSSFFLKDGVVNTFDKTKPSKYWEDYEKVSLCYIWQFAIDGNVYYGRELEQFLSLIDDLNSINDNCKYIIFVHNLSYEFQFLRNLFNDEIEVFARQVRHPFYFTYRNFEFRCSYMLTRLSLDSWAKSKHLCNQKLVGNLDYLVPRTPKTHLKKNELEYCFQDVRVVCEGIKEYKERFGHVVEIPLTQTGVVRKQCEKLMRSEIGYCKKMSAIYPDTIEEMQLLIDIFMGGYTHANMLDTGITIENVASYDLTSSYPAVMVFEKYPMTKFLKVSHNYEKYMNDDRYCYIVEFIAYNIDSQLSHSFLSKSFCSEIVKGIYDNGRIICADSVKVKMTNIDFEIFKKAYKYDNLVIINFYIARTGYLNNKFCLYILELFNNKTKYKGVEGYEDLYAKSKEEINALFGMAVTRDITDEVVFNKDWKKELLTSEIYNEKVTKKKRNIRRCYTTFAHGMWITAYARRNLWLGVFDHSDDIIYMDTDSHKVENWKEHIDYYNAYNEEVFKKQEESAKRLGIDVSMFNPVSPKGEVSSLGTFKFEGEYKKFRTLGAKKYICETDEGLEMTVSGVRKKAVSQISDIEEFKNGLVFDIDHANKLLMNYNDCQSSFIANRGSYDEYESNYKYGINAQPTTYALSMTDEYLDLINNIDNMTEIFRRKGQDL